MTNLSANRSKRRFWWLALVCASLVAAWQMGTRHKLDPAIDTRNDVDRRLALLRLAESESPRDLQALVKALGASRGEVRQEVRQVLSERLTQWNHLPPRDAAARINMLATSLADAFDSWDDDAKRDAAELAERMLAWQIDRRAVGCGPMLTACDVILRGRPIETPTASRPRGDQSSRKSAPVEGQTADEAPLARSAAEISQLAGGGLPIEAAALPGTAKDDLQRLSAAGPARVARAHDQVETAANSSATASPVIPAQAVAPLRQPEPAARQATAIMPVDMDEARTFRLMQNLHDADPKIVEFAATQLRRIGFSSLHLEMARQLTSSDPAMRRQLVELLPRANGVDAKVWLEWLIRDEDPQVRLAAIGVMATTGDPKILARIAQITRDDPDPRIQEQGERIMQSQRKK